MVQKGMVVALWLKFYGGDYGLLKFFFIMYFLYIMYHYGLHK